MVSQPNHTIITVITMAGPISRITISTGRFIMNIAMFRQFIIISGTAAAGNMFVPNRVITLELEFINLILLASLKTAGPYFP